MNLQKYKKTRKIKLFFIYRVIEITYHYIIIVLIFYVHIYNYLYILIVRNMNSIFIETNREYLL